MREHLSPAVTAIETQGIDAEDFRKKLKINLIYY